MIARMILGITVLTALGAGGYIGHRFWSARDVDEPACCVIGEEAPNRSVAAALSSARPPVDLTTKPPVIPDVPVVDQRGRALRFHSDLVKGRVVAINFFFTSCKTVCPPMAAVYSKLQRMPGVSELQLISVSIDPVNDTRERLAEWAQQFEAGPNWALVTGAKRDIDRLLKALGAFSAEKSNHVPFVLLGDDKTGTWRRVSGLSAPETIQAAAQELIAASVADQTRSSENDDQPKSPSHRYFTDVPLVNQHGETLRLYSDLLRGKVVVIHVFFSECKGTCPLMMATYKRLQEHLGDRLGRDILLLSLTVDPRTDSQAALNGYAKRLSAHQGWHFLTGTRENVAVALKKLGMAVERREEHSNVFIIGNESTGLWKKVRGLAPAEEIIAALEGVIGDQAPKRQTVPPERVETRE